MKMKSFEFRVPVYKQGDDFHYCLDTAEQDTQKALFLLAQHYEEAGRLCRNLAEQVPANTKSYGDTHFIELDLDNELGQKLVKQELLVDMDEFYGDDQDEYDNDEYENVEEDELSDVDVSEFEEDETESD